MTPTVKFPQFMVIEASAPALQLGTVGFYGSTVSALGTAGTLSGVKST